MCLVELSHLTRALGQACAALKARPTGEIGVSPRHCNMRRPVAVFRMIAPSPPNNIDAVSCHEIFFFRDYPLAQSEVLGTSATDEITTANMKERTNENAHLPYIQDIYVQTQ